MIITQASKFRKIYKKMNKNQAVDVNNAIKFIMDNPTAGQQKKGDLSRIRVYKFKCINQLMLLAYTVTEDCFVLLDLGSHENFYKNLKH